MSSNNISLPPLREVMDRYDLTPKKSLGQNFLLNPAITDRIANSAGPLKDQWVLEVGPGPGGLTRSLLGAGAKVIAIEQDSRCVAALQELQASYPDRLEIIEGDALTYPTANIIERITGKLQIIANLPYNIATPLLVKWLQELELFSQFTLMFQKEVAQRLIATPSTSAYGRLSVMTQWLCEASIVLELAPGSFTPPPKVDSAVVKFEPRTKPLGEAGVTWKELEKVTQAAFNQRRKMLRAGLKGFLPQPEAVLQQADIDPTLRAETLSIEDFCRLAKVWDKDGRK